MIKLGSRTVVLSALLAAGVLAAPAAPAQARPPAMVVGLGHFVYDEPGLEGHRIWFGVRAAQNRGRFWFRHEYPDGSLVAEGTADVTCLRVTGRTALFTAIVPDGTSEVRHHGFYVKIIDSDRGPDLIADAQATNGPTPPPRDCYEPGDMGRPFYPIRRGGYAVIGG